VKFAFFIDGSISVSLHLMISHLKILSKVDLAMPPTPYVAYLEEIKSEERYYYIINSHLQEY